VACHHDAARLRRVLVYVVVAAVPRYLALALEPRYDLAAVRLEGGSGQ
jgi:hypothetical protein